VSSINVPGRVLTPQAGTAKVALAVALAAFLFVCSHSAGRSEGRNYQARPNFRLLLTPAANPPTWQSELPRGAASEGTFRFVVLGDTGTGGRDQLAIADRMSAFHDERPYDTVIMLGDNIYPNGSPSDLPAKFERPYAELLRRGVHFYAALGNHDVREGRAAQVNYKYFNMGGRSYYSFTKEGNLVEFFALDSTDLDAAQLEWLKDALGKSTARWKIAYLHHPIYSSGKRHGSDVRARALLEPLFVQYDVAVAFSGHDHFYERTIPQQGVQYFVSGAGGKIRRGNINRRSPFFAAGNDEVNSFIYVEVTKERLNFWAVDQRANIVDQGMVAARDIE
jgi:hypothetical protein